MSKIAAIPHQLPADVANVIVLHQVPGLTGDAGSVTIGYDDNGKRRVTAEALLPTFAEAKAFLADRVRIGALIAQGVRAMPASRRPGLPAWIADSVEAKHADDMRRRANTVAIAAADRQEQAGLPWAA